MFCIKDYITAARQYKNEMEAIIDKDMQDYLDTFLNGINKYSRVALYGAGGFTKYLLGIMKKNSLSDKVCCILDKESGSQIEGIKVYSLHEGINLFAPQAIVISSLIYQEVIYQRLLLEQLHEIDLIRIYPDIGQKATERSYAAYEKDGVLHSTIPMDHLQRYGWAIGFICGKSIVDIACGSGYGSAWLSEYAEEVIGVDVDDDALEWARKHYNRENLSYIRGDVSSFKMSKKFDVVVSFETIEHIPNEKDYLNTIKGLLNKDGIFIVSTPLSSLNGMSSTNCYHINEYKKDRFVKMISENFTRVLWYRQDEGNDYSISIDDGQFLNAKEDNTTVMIAVAWV